MAIALSDSLSVGAAYRVAYGQAQVKVAQLANPADPTQGFIEPETSFSGTTPAAVQAGVLYRLADTVRVGFNYRSKLPMTMKGDTKIDGTVVAKDTELKTAEPHKFVLGAATDLGKLLLALEARYWLDPESHHKDAKAGRAADWQDAMSFGLGGEYHVTDEVPVRLGYSLGRMATT